jgi:hypothetical protein
MKKAISFMLTLVVAMLGFATQAQAPQTGIYRIQNVGKSTYIKVTGKYDAQLVASQSDASYIKVGIEKKLNDGTYKVNSLSSTYGEDNTPVEVYDYITKALTLGEVELRKILANSSEENVQRAINTMHQLAKEYGFMRLMPVEGQADTYHSIAVLPTIPDSVVVEWRKKIPVSEFSGTMWEWCKELVLNYLDTHGTDAGLAAKIRNNLANIEEGHTYMLTADPDGSFGYIDVTGSLTSDNNRSWWKLTPKVNTDNVKDGTYKIRNIGKEKYVRIISKYYAKPDADEADASDIRITFNGKNENGDQKIVNLGGTAPDGTNIDGYEYIKKAIMIGKTAIYQVLTGGNGVNPASPENIEYAQQFMEDFVKDNAVMSIKPVPGKDDAVYAYAYIPHIPEEVVTQMYNHGAITADDESLAWAFGVQKVKDYLAQGGTDNTLATYVLANIDNIQPNTTYYLSAHPSDGTFDYAAEGEFSMDDEYFQWGFDVEEVEDDNLTSGTYKIRNVEYKNYVHVISKYYAKPNTDEENATEIHITYNGKLDDGSYKVTNMSAVADDGSQVDIQSYVDKAIKLGKVAIADVLNGKSTEENIKRAQQYMEDFVRANAYMRVKPVVGTNYVYAIATVPEIPYDVYHEMYRHGVIAEDTKEAAWTYGVNYVLNYLDTHGTNSTLAALIRNNIGNIKQGHTYYLSEDADGTFGYKDYDEGEVNLDDKTLQWGIDLEEEDQPVESDFYKIHNVGNDFYIEVVAPYYATPSADEANATPIAVTIAEGQLEDGSYKITNLVGDGQDIQKYVAHAIEIGTALIHQLLDDISSPENVERAIQAMTDFVNENAYMRVKLVPGETDAYYAYVVLPTVPDSIVTEWEKKYPNYEGTMRDWAIEKVLQYLDTHNTNGKLASMIRNNIGRLYEGHTYYLRADKDKTLGFGDATLGEVDFTDQYYWWGFADAIKAEPVNGYFRIKGADGKYVNVTGKFEAKPDADADAAKTEAGTVIYVGTGETKNSKTLPLEILRSQGVDVGDYMSMINEVLTVVANTASQMLAEKLEENPNYSQYASLVGPMVQTLLESADLNLYVEPTITSDGKNAYMLEVNIPDLKEYCDLALDALSLMGKTQAQLVAKLQELEANATGAMAKLYNIAWRTAQYLDDPDEMWIKLKENAQPYVNQYFIQSDNSVLQTAGQLILNALNNPDFNYGTTYCLRQDADHTFGYASRESLANVDAGKWILEPFDEQDPNYDAEAYIPFVVNTEFDQEAFTSTGKATGNIFYYTTTYLDFEAKIETSNVTAYTVTATEKKNVTKKDGTPVVVYMATLSSVGTTIPAATPVVLKAQADGEIELRPINKPEHPAVESGELEEVKDQILDMFNNKINGGTQGAPRPKVISEPTDENLLVGSFFGDEIKAIDSNNYLELGKNDNTNGGLEMKGLGFWKANISELEGNTAYLKGAEFNAEIDDWVLDESKMVDFSPLTDYNSGKDGDAPGYVFQFEDDTNTAIDNVTTTKQVKSVRYYNTLGIDSATPFDGVNVVVTTYSDGTSSTMKVIK